MTTTEAVVFDWYATLAAPNPDDFWPNIPQRITAAGGVVDPDALQAWGAHPLLHLEHSTDERTYQRWEHGRMDELFARCAIDEPARSQLIRAIEDERYSRGFTVFDGVPAVLADLRARGLVVGVCSNWDWDLDRHLRANRIDDLLDFVVCSAVIGRRKPHPTIFDEVVRLAGVPADRIVFVGDNWGADVEGATAAGMRAVHVATGDRCTDLDHGSVPCLADLRELARVLDHVPEIVDLPPPTGAGANEISAAPEPTDAAEAEIGRVLRNGAYERGIERIEDPDLLDQ